MFIEHEIFIGLRDIGLNNKVTNTALLSYFEDAGGIHSNIAGYGLKDIPQIRKSWMLLNYQIKIFERPSYGEKIIIKTWSRGIDKLYAYRDFEILNSKKEIIGIATSKWVLIDIDNFKIIRLTQEDICNKYSVEEKSVFEKPKLGKIKEFEEYEYSSSFTINRNLIDVNRHLHNIYFMDIANEVLPDDVYENCEFNDIKFMCKKEIKLGDTVNVYGHKEKDTYNIVIKSENNENLHAIIKLSI